MSGLWALRLGHLRLPLCLEGVAVGFAHVVQNAACQNHGGHHVQSAVVPLAQTLPACPQPQKCLLGGAQRSAEPSIKEPLWLGQRCVAASPILFLGIGLHQPTLERVAGLPQQNIPGRTRWLLVSYSTSRKTAACSTVWVVKMDVLGGIFLDFYRLNHNQTLSAGVHFYMEQGRLWILSTLKYLRYYILPVADPRNPKIRV